MKVAVVGSRNLTVDNLGAYLPQEVTELVSGGAKGIDTCAKVYAESNGLVYKEFLPKYALYQRGAPLKRNLEIVEYVDMVIAFWDGKSRGTRFTIDACTKAGKEIKVILL